ncbi:hypothetical protein NUSPORA_00427 [Nucleospora cyclopteri]
MKSEKQRYIRKEFENYLNEDIQGYRISDRQKEAIEKLLKLPDLKFGELCADVMNEIKNRRGQLDVDRTGTMFERLMKLSEIKFKNLIIDILLVHNYRFKESIGEKNEMIKSLETMVETLKSTYSADSFIKKSENLNFFNKLLEFTKYTRKFVKEPEICDFIEDTILSEIERNSCLFIESISYPEILLERLQKGDSAVNDEIIVIKNRILQKKSDGCDFSLIKNDYMKIFDLLMTTVEPYSIIFEYDQEISDLCSLLEEIVDDNGKNLDFEKIRNGRILPIVDSVIKQYEIKEKKSNKDFDEEMDKLKMQRFLVQGLNNLSEQSSGLSLICEIARNVQKIAKRSTV